MSLPTGVDPSCAAALPSVDVGTATRLRRTGTGFYDPDLACSPSDYEMNVGLIALAYRACLTPVHLGGSPRVYLFRVMKPEFRKPASSRWVPNTDVYSTDTGLVIKVELSGMRSEHLEITVEGNRLRISGDRPDTCRAHKASFLVMEINYGPFESVLELPKGYDLSQARASYLNGFLRIDVPPKTPPPGAPPQPPPPPNPQPIRRSKPQGPTIGWQD